MTTTEELLKEYASLSGNDDAASEARKKEILDWLKAHESDEVRATAKEFVNEQFDKMEQEVAVLRSKISDDDYKLLPMSYIARTYFGKSAAWLSQRINGTLVRGKVYTLNAEQKRIFNDALRDISSRIGSLHLA